jgi:L-iditol 2-dehydrogenase
MTQKIRASVLHGVRDVRLVSTTHPMQNALANISKEERSLDAPKEDELQISVRSTGICGSDLHYYHHYRNGDIIVREPMSLGHESAGVIDAVGSSVAGFEVGDRVALEAGIPCGNCDRCDEGRYNLCKSMSFRSSAKSFPHFQGTLQEKVNHPAAWCHR